MSWSKNLKTNLSKKTLLYKPINIFLKESLNIGFNASYMFKINKHIYCRNYLYFCKINTNNFELTTDNNFFSYNQVIYSDNNYICTLKPEYLYICSLNMEYINKIIINQISGLIIDNNNNVLVSTRECFRIYKINGLLVKEWKLSDGNHNFGSRNIELNGNEIFMIYYSYNCVNVFSYGEELIRYWGDFGRVWKF